MLQIAMSPRLAHRQSIVITPQLQQAITMLQMTNLELQSHLDEIALENPFLEVDRPAAAEARHLPQAATIRREQRGDFDYVAALPDRSGESLLTHVLAQLDSLVPTQADRVVAHALCAELDPSGRIARPLEEIASELGCHTATVERVLLALQKAEPAGIFARGLAECLRLQARECGAEYAPLIALIDNLDLLAKGDIARLARQTGIAKADLPDLIRRLKQLDPKPGLRFDPADLQPIREPDLIAQKDENGDWQVQLNRSTLPAVRVSSDQAQKVRKTLRSEEDMAFVRQSVSAANWLRRAIAQRNETSLKIGAEIVRRQAGFLDHGPAHLRPLQLRDIASAVGVHESTVSRVTSSLMMATPRGAFPLRAFFGTALRSHDDVEGASAAAIRDRIKALVEGEPPHRPLSDEAISRLIRKDGVEIARRTVAKYREMEGIPSSARRKRRQEVDAFLSRGRITSSVA